MSLHVCFIEDKIEEGGTQIWVGEAARVFLGKGAEVTILTPDSGFNAKNGKEIDHKNFHLVTYDYEKDGEDPNQAIWTEALRPCDVAVATIVYPRIYDREKKEDNSTGFHVVSFAAKCIKEAELKTVLCPKTGTFVPWFNPQWYKPEGIRSRCITITAYTKKSIVEEFKIPEEHIEVLYQGTDIKRFTSSPENKAEGLKRYQAPADSWPVFVHIGTYDKRKNQDIILQAVDIVRKDYPKMFLHLVGKGETEEAMKKMAFDLRLDSHVKFQPFTKEPNFVFEAADAVLLASSVEGLPNVLLEGYAMEKAAVSTIVGGTPEIVVEDKTGFLCQPRDVEGLAEAMKKLCAAGPEECIKMGKAGREHILGKMDKATQFDAYLKFFANLKGGEAAACCCIG